MWEKLKQSKNAFLRRVLFYNIHQEACFGLTHIQGFLSLFKNPYVEKLNKKNPERLRIETGTKEQLPGISPVPRVPRLPMAGSARSQAHGGHREEATTSRSAPYQGQPSLSAKIHTGH